MKFVLTPNDGKKNCTIQATISGPEPDGALVRYYDLTDKPPRIRIDCITYAISEGAEIILSWVDGENPSIPFLALSGRGRLDYDHAGGLAQLCKGLKDPGIDITLLRMSDSSVISLVLECEKS